MSNASDFIIENGVLKKYKGPGGDVVVPEGVTSIGYGAFWGCSSLTSVTIPDSVTSIGDSAFTYCSRLTSVTIPDSVTSIGGSAFYGCSRLMSVTIPDGVTSIGGSAFYGCSRLTSVTIPDSVTSIGNNTFSGTAYYNDKTNWENNALYVGKTLIEVKTNVTDEFSVKSGTTCIASNAFRDCSSLTSITIPDSVTSIGYEAFCGCSSLTALTIPDSVTSIERNAFYGCSSLTSVTIPDSVTSIGDGAFYGCSSLTGVTIPDGVTSIGDGAFDDCTGLTSITIPDSVTSIGDSAFQWCSNLKSITLPEGVTSIGGWAFHGCSKLQKLEMSGCHAKLKSYVFGNTLPSGLVSQLPSLYPYMAEGALKQYVLEKKAWKKLNEDLWTEVFLTRQGKSLEGAYKECIGKEQIEPLGNAILSRLGAAKPSQKDCTAAAAYMTLFHKDVHAELLKLLYEALKRAKTGAKALKTVEANVALMEGFGCEVKVDASLSPVGQKVMTALIAEKKNAKDAEKELKELYSLTLKDLPVLKSAQGTAVEPFAAAWLLTAHEAQEQTARAGVVAECERPGLRPEAAEVVAMFDPAGLQAALLQLANANLGLTGRSKKMYLAFPICRYADEANMAALTKRAPKWSTSVSGDNAPPLREFRAAAMYSDTRAAMLFAERYHELDKYAALRGMTEDELRDKYLSDVGLDEEGGKVYDLGSQTVTARLQKDLSFLVELPGGKTAKSLPKKGADPEKYEAASRDFSEMKKSVKKILTSRGKVLFEDFLSGRERPAAEWQGSYLNNPLLKCAAKLVIWAQGKKTFTLTDTSLVDSAGTAYTITDEPIRVAHPMEMKAEDVEAWQKYYTAKGLKQPFLQIWEPVRKAEEIKKDRYKDCVLEIYQLNGKDKHGIHSYGLHAYSEDFGFDLDDCQLGYEPSIRRLGWDGATGETYKLGAFKFKKFTRKVNHIVTILDGLTVAARVKKDDASVMDLMSGFTLAQITEFIAAAQEANAVNVLAALLEYNNASFADFDPMDEFTLEW